MDVDKIAKSLLNECKDCGERFRCGNGEQLIYCQNRDAAERLKELNDFQSSQCAKLLAHLTASYARIAELEAEVTSREQSGIEEHNEVHYWRDRARKAESDLLLLQSHDKEVMELLEAAISHIPHICETCNVGKRADKDCWCNKELKNYVFDSWVWQHADRYEALKAQSPTKNTDGEG